MTGGTFTTSTNSIFGNQAQTQPQNSFGSSAPNSIFNNTNSIFNNNAAKQIGGTQRSPFGGQAMMFGFNQGQGQTQGQASMFGFNQNQGQTQGQTSMFGFNQAQNTSSPNFPNQPQNSLFNPSQTTFTPRQLSAPPSLLAPSSPFKPLKSRNLKLDEKHVVKCISELPENQGFCRRELRIRYITHAVNQINSQGGGVGSFGQGVGGGGGGGVGVGGQNGFNNSNNNFNTSNSFFNQAGTGNNPFNQTSFGNNPFGQNTQQQQSQQNFNAVTNALFGPKTTSIFGPSNTNNIFGTPNTGFPSNQNPFQTNSSFQPQGQSNFSPQLAQTGYFPQPNPFQQQQNQQLNQQLYKALSQSFFANQPQPHTGLFAPADNNSITVFPSHSDPSPTLNNAALSLFTTSTTPPAFGPYSQPATNPLNSIFGLLTNYLTNPVLQSIFMNCLSSSQAYKNLEYTKRDKLFNRISEDIRNRGRFDQSSVRFYDQERERRGREEDDRLVGFRRTKRSLEATRQPYIFQREQKKTNLQPIFYAITSRSTQQRNKQKYGFTPKNIQQQTPKQKHSAPTPKKTPFSKFQQNYQQFKKQILQQIKTKPEQLPQNDLNYKLTPSLQRMQQMTPGELRGVANVHVENQYGIVMFKQPVCLYRKLLSQCVEIGRDQIQLKGDWDGKRCVMVYKNFCQYKDANISQRAKIRRKVAKWVLKNNLKNQHIDENTGNLTVQAPQNLYF